MRKPYIGITGITQSFQTRAIDQMLKELDWPVTHRVMYGVLVSGWTLQGKPPSDKHQYPLADKVNELRSRHPQSMNLIHFNNGQRPTSLDLQLGSLKSIAPNFDGVQLNFTWPNPIELRQAEAIAGEIVLQIGSKALRAAGPENIGQWLRPYGGIVDYVLVDLSGGIGKPFDTVSSSQLLNELTIAGRFYRLDMSLGIAGGLNAERIPTLEPLIRRFPNLSWDAQAGLRNDTGELDLERVRRYLEASLLMIRTMTAYLVPEK